MRRSDLILLAILAAPPVLAAEPSPAPPSDALDEIVVTASRVPERLSSVPASISVRDRAEMDTRGDLYLGDELTGLPNIQVQRFDSGTYTALTIRGVPNRIHNDTLAALLDGVPLLTGDDEVDLEQLPREAVGRVEVIRGTSSALYGRGAIAGTLAYQTHEVAADDQGAAQLSLGSFGLVRGEAEAATSLGGSDRLGIWATGERADGWRDRTPHWTGSLFLKDVVPLEGVGRLTGWIAQLDTDQRIAGDLPVDAKGAFVPLPRGVLSNFQNDKAGFGKAMTLATAILESELADGLTLTARLHYRHADTLARQGFYQGIDPAAGTITFTGFKVQGDTDTAFAEDTLVWEAGPSRLVAGLSAEAVKARHVETWTGEFDDAAGLFYAERRLIATGALINQASWRQDRLLDAHGLELDLAAYMEERLDLGYGVALTGGVRFDHVRRRTTYGPTLTGDGPTPPGYVSTAHGAASPKGALSWNEGPATLYVSYGAGFSPGFGPLWSFRARDTALKPEHAETWEAGAKLATPDFTASLAAFRLDRHDLIELLIEQPSARTVNAGQQRAEGVEAEAAARLAPGLTGTLAYGYVDSRWIDNRFLDPDSGLPYDFSGRRVQGIPKHTGSVALTRRWGGVLDGDLSATGWAEATGDSWYDNQNTVRGGGAVLLNASLEWSRGPLLLRATVRNLTDRATRLVTANNDGPLSAYPGLPRQVELTARLGL